MLKLILYNMILRIKEICKEKGLTLNEVAQRVGISQPSMSSISNGKINPSFETLLLLSDALGCRVGELFDAPPPKNEKNIICPHCGKVVFRVSDFVI